VLYQLYYEQQSASTNTLAGDHRIFAFPPSPVSPALEDSMLDPVHQAWVKAMGDDVSEETLADYMIFTDREKADDDYE
jgi:Rab proteins geranylgeranyltransferase component A